MNKTEFIKAFADKAGFTQKDAQVAYDAFVDVITAALKKNDKVALLGFGSFELRKKAARTAKNPQTGKPVKVPASKAPAFKVSKAWKAEFNNK